ncbi:hypothetical protein VTN00DRAFT_7560 [Thermoascus crustaceus]|uniref:uncharacterized protein n=1 Tax=Thermoascus crustaceus TaxID=5088 RepID=UPI003744A71C
MLANQAAVIVSSSSGAKLFEVESLEQLYANLYISQIITVAGILPVALITFRLHRAGMNSRYILILSAITIVTSNVALFMNRSTSVTDTFQRLQRLQQFPQKLEKCGFNPPPLVYCVNPIVVWFHDIVNSVSVQLMDIPCLVIFALALIYQAIQRYLSNRMETEYGQLKRFLTSPWVRALRVFVKLVINGYLIMAKCFYFFFLFSLRGIDFTSWSFGQIVAVTIWAPVIFKYIYWTAFGTAAYSSTRVALPYIITKAETQDILDNTEIGNVVENTEREEVVDNNGDIRSTDIITHHFP